MGQFTILQPGNFGKSCDLQLVQKLKGECVKELIHNWEVEQVSVGKMH